VLPTWNFKCVLPKLYLLKRRDFAFWKQGRREKYLKGYYYKERRKNRAENKSRVSKGQRNKTHAGKEKGDRRMPVGVWEL